MKEEKIHVILRQAAHLQIDISEVMNAGFCDSKCYLMQFLCVVLFVCVVVALKEPSYGHGGFMQTDPVPQGLGPEPLHGPNVKVRK